MFSWPKERALGETSNLIRVLAEQNGWSEAESFHEACRACDRVVLDYIAARGTITCEDRDALDLLESWMQGNYDWHAVGTARYAEHLSVAPASAEDSVGPRMSEFVFSIRIPSIAPETSASPQGAPCRLAASRPSSGMTSHSSAR